MQRKPKITGFARFILIMVLVTPLAYLGASYYNGEDGIANIKNFLGIDKEDTVEMEDERFVPTREETPSVEDKDVEEMREELKYQEKRLEDLKKENERLRKSVFEKEQELSNLKNQ